jgi:hypothetical protein
MKSAPETSTGEDKDSLLTIKTLIGALMVGIILLVISSILGVESFKLKKCLVQDKSLEGCELERHSVLPTGVKIVLEVLGSSLIVSSLTIAFLELQLRDSNKNLLTKIIKKQHGVTVSSINENFSQKIDYSYEEIRKIIKAELITTKDIHEFYPSYIEYVSRICKVFEQSLDLPEYKSNIDIIEIGDKLLPNINHDLCSKVLCGLKVRLLIVNKNDQTQKKVQALNSLIIERIKTEYKASRALGLTSFGSLEIAFLLDSSTQYFDYFTLNSTSKDNRKELMFMCFHEPDINISLPGLSIANPLFIKKFETYFDSRWNENRVEHIMKIDKNRALELVKDNTVTQTEVERINRSREAPSEDKKHLIIESDEII